MLVVRVDERSVEVEERGVAQLADAVFSRCFACTPSQNSSIIFFENAGMSSGFGS